MTVTRYPAPFSLNVKDFGAKGDGSTDDTAHIQAAIDACAAVGGGTVVIPATTNGYKCVGLVLKAGVTLKSGVSSYGYLGTSPAPATKLIAAGTGVVIDTPATHINGCAVDGINIYGLGAGTAVKGIRFQDVDWGAIRNCHIMNVADEGIITGANCNALTLENILVVSSVLNRSRSAIIGAVDISGNDHYLSRIEAGISGTAEGTVQSASLWCVAFALRGSAMFISNCSGEFSDCGWRITGSYNRLVNCRGDLNYGPGFYLEACNHNSLVGCLGLNNSQHLTNTYDDFYVPIGSGGNLFSTCHAVSTLTKKARYGFRDEQANATNKNFYLGCWSATGVTGQFSMAGSNGSWVGVPRSAYRTLTADSATPDVTGYEHWVTANTVATGITGFTGLVPGQRLTILCNDANTTIQHNGSTIILPHLGYKKLRSGCYYEFIANSPTAVREIVPLPLGVTADVGDAAKTLSVGTSEETQIWNTPLTTVRSVGLSTFGAHPGAKFRIVRTAAATGGSALNVGTGPLAALAAGQWCDIEYNGSAWVLTAAGSL